VVVLGGGVGLVVLGGGVGIQLFNWYCCCLHGCWCWAHDAGMGLTLVLRLCLVGNNVLFRFVYLFIVKTVFKTERFDEFLCAKFTGVVGRKVMKQICSDLTSISPSFFPTVL
jgi:hypothetical protein